MKHFTKLSRSVDGKMIVHMPKRLRSKKPKKPLYKSQEERAEAHSHFELRSVLEVVRNTYDHDLAVSAMKSFFENHHISNLSERSQRMLIYLFATNNTYKFVFREKVILEALSDMDRLYYYQLLNRNQGDHLELERRFRSASWHLATDDYWQRFVRPAKAA